MAYYSSQISRLIEELSKLPGIGPKTAQRLAFHIINMPKDQASGLASAIVDARENIRYCSQCFNLTDSELCPICRNEKRSKKTIMVVETPRDLAAYEKTGKGVGKKLPPIGHLHISGVFQDIFRQSAGKQMANLSRCISQGILELYPSFQSTQKRDFVDILQISANRNATGDSTDFDSCRLY